MIVMVMDSVVTLEMDTIQLTTPITYLPLAYLSQFNFTDTTYFCIGSTSSTNLNVNFNIYPNPSKGEIYLHSTDINKK